MGEAILARTSGAATGKKWGKWSALKRPYLVQTATSSSGNVSSDGMYDSTREMQCGTSYTFDPYTGYALAGTILTQRVTQTVGYYILQSSYTYDGLLVYRRVLKVASTNYESGYYGLVGYSTSSNIDHYYYLKGDTKYCSVISNEGTNQPEVGTLLFGSGDSDTCAIDVNGTYYYYEKE